MTLRSVAVVLGRGRFHQTFFDKQKITGPQRSVKEFAI